MKPVLILYQSFSGFTARYAQWLGEELAGIVFPLKRAEEGLRQDPGLVIFGGSVHGGEICGWKTLRKLWRKRRFPLICFATGIRPSTQQREEVLRNSNFSRETIPFFYVRGGLELGRLSQGDRTILRCYRAMLSRRRNRTAEEDETLRAMETPADHSSREQLKPLLCCVRRELETLAAGNTNHEKERKIP